MSEVQDLRRRRGALDTELGALREQRERASRANSFALSRQRAGVTQHDEADMKELADDEVAGDAAITDLRRQIESIDTELARDDGRGVTATRRRVGSWLRK